jgi:hypothetical protein
MSDHPSHLSAHVRHPHGSSAAPAGQRIDARSASHADIAKRAYERYEARGCAHGFDREDWNAASRELSSETFGHLSSSPSRALLRLPDRKSFPGA